MKEECYYANEVIELIEEDLNHHHEIKEGLSEDGFAKCQYAIGVLKHLLAKVKTLEITRNEAI